MIILTWPQRILIGALMLLLLAIVMSLVQRRKLRVSQGLMWSALLVAGMVVLLVPGLLVLVTKATGAKEAVSALSLLAFVVLALIIVFQEAKICELDRRLVNLSREMGIAERERHKAAQDDTTRPQQGPPEE